MKVGAFIYGASKDHQNRQRRGIKAMFDGEDVEVRWFTEAQGHEKREQSDRKELQRCTRHCRTNSATFAVQSTVGMFPRKWQALTWLKHQVEMYDMKIKVADDPLISKGSVHVLSAAADQQRNFIAEKSRAAIDHIKRKLEEDGAYTSKAGRKITRLGVHDKLSDAGRVGNDAQAALARQRDDEVWPLIQRCLAQGMGYSATARHLNKLNVSTPSERARHNRDTTGNWYASTVRNIALRREK